MRPSIEQIVEEQMTLRIFTRLPSLGQAQRVSKTIALALKPADEFTSALDDATAHKLEATLRDSVPHSLPRKRGRSKASTLFLPTRERISPCEER